MASVNSGKLDQIIERTRAVNLVHKLQTDFQTLAEGKSWVNAAKIARELSDACLALQEIEYRQRELQLELAGLNRVPASQYLLAV